MSACQQPGGAKPADGPSSALPAESGTTARVAPHAPAPATLAPSTATPATAAAGNPAAAGAASLQTLPLHLQTRILIQAGAPLTTCKAAALVGKEAQLTAEWLHSTRQWPLLKAAAHKLWDACHRLLDMGVSDPAPVRYWAVCRAAKAGQTQLVTRLLESAESVSSPTTQGSCDRPSLRRDAMGKALLAAAARNDLPTCHILIRVAPCLAGEKSDYQYPLEVAAAQGHAKVVRYFLDVCRQHGGKELESRMVRKAFARAAGGDHLEVAKLLLERVEDVNYGRPFFEEESLLANAIYRGKSEVIQMLLDRGAHTHADPAIGEAESAMTMAINNRSSEAFEALLADKRSVLGVGELHAAVEQGDIKVLCLLLESEVNKWDHRLASSQQSRSECIGQALLLAIQQCRIHPYYCPSCGDWEEPQDNTGVVGALLAPPPHWGAVSPETLAQGVHEVINVVRDHEAGSDMAAVIELLAKSGADLDVDDGALLKTAVKYCSVSILEAVIEAGADIRRHGKAAAQLATDSKCAAALLKAGVVIDPDDPSPLLERFLSLSLEFCDGNKDLITLLASLPSTTPGLQAPDQVAPKEAQ